MEENASSIYKSNLLHQISSCLSPVFQFPIYTAFKKHERPSLVMTEITITNIEDHHKGRVDVLAHGIV